MSEAQIINMSENQITGSVEEKQVPSEEDLEDGEITDDDDNEDIVEKSHAAENDIKTQSSPYENKNQTQPNGSFGQSTTDKNQGDDNDSTTLAKHKSSLEDDYASTIENAIASALKKKGIEPTMPKIEARVGIDNKNNETVNVQGQSRGSRRRKRKKQRDEKEKDNERKEKKKLRYESPEPNSNTFFNAPASLEDNEEDDYEMLNMRGGSPPLKAGPPVSIPLKEQYDTGDDSSSTYESYESPPEDGNQNDGTRHRRRNKKDTRKRRDRNVRSRDDDRGNSRQDKRSRRDSADDKYRSEPKKLEICKFYLMECCAKKDKCSYMHSDFPCKYYYLGMECVYKDTCKFAHGEPLTEQLRNILLKHLEVAPKEILGNFKRISRETAIAQISKRHEELCNKYGVENTWSTITNSQPTHNSRRVEQQVQTHQNQPHSNIPSLLDMVINPPPNLAQSKNEKQRKSRWTTSNSGSKNRSSNIEPPSGSAPSYLDLKNLTGILSVEHIEKLSELGIVNLEQVNQLTFGQLNDIGLTIAQISEIQLNAMNMAKLGVPKANTSETAGGVESSGEQVSKKESCKNKTSRDVDMRFIPRVQNTTESEESGPSFITDKDLPVPSNSNSNSSSSVAIVDYTQYLKDSNLGQDRVDMYDDEKDESQLIIDDENAVLDENICESSVTKTGVDSHKTEEEDKLYSSFSSLYSKNNKKDGANFPLRNLPHPSNPFETDDSLNGDEHEESRPRSRSQTPTRSQSATPEASNSPELNDFSTHASYERTTMYDYDPQQIENEETDANNWKSDKDMRFMSGSTADGLNDIDLRLPFLPVTNYTPATEIDGSITSHLPMTYKVYIVDIPIPSYVELRKNFKADHTSDPRLRRILGLPELLPSKTSVALGRNVRKLSNNIASPESGDASPKYYVPPSSTSTSVAGISQQKTENKNASKSNVSQVRVDPRRKNEQNTTESKNSAPSSTKSLNYALKQNSEIRNLLQKSEWYKNLNSKFKIMVNQQLALVSTELKKFHQDDSPNKVFDISFIVNSSTLQQILTNLGIYIDDNGEVAYVDSDTEGSSSNNEGSDSTGVNNSGIALPNLSLPPPQQQLDFLRAPPPNIVAPISGAVGQQLYRSPIPGSLNISGFCQHPNSRPSLLGLPPGATTNIFNPFATGNQNFIGVQGGPALMGAFGNFGSGPPLNQNTQSQQRNFNTGNQHRNQRNQQNRRNKI